LLDFFTQKKSLSKHGAGKTLGKKQPQGGRMIRFKKHLITGSLILGALAAPALGLADDTTAAAPAATPVATPTPLAWYQKLTVGGYLDEYYQVDFNRPADSFGSGEPMFRAFDTTSNQFTFGGGELTRRLRSDLPSFRCQLQPFLALRPGAAVPRWCGIGLHPALQLGGDGLG
jgi:hypothetical protein